MSQYSPKLYEPFSGDINIKVDLSNYAKKSNIKNISHFDTSRFALKTNLANLKTDVDKLDIDNLKSLPNDFNNLKIRVDKLDINKLVPAPVDLSKLSNVVKNEVVKKLEYNANIKSIEDKIPHISNLATKTNLNTKINEVKNKIPSIRGLATTSALTAVENKIPSVTNLVKKTNFDTKVSETEKKFTDLTHDKYITIPEFKKLTTENFAARLKQANLVTKTDFDNKLLILNRKISSNETNQLVTENELKKLKTFDQAYFIGKNHFDETDTQNCYIFQPISKYFTTTYTNDINYILSWQSRGLNDVKIGTIKTKNYLLNPHMDIYD